MFLLHEPRDGELRRALDEARAGAFTYTQVGATLTELPAGYDVNRIRARLGRGEEEWRRAAGALRRWAMYDLPWTRVSPSGAPVAAGAEVLTVVRHLGFWSVNPCRVVYVQEEEDGQRQRFSFAIGTLPGHAECGEERFTVEHDRSDGAVWYELVSFTVPGHPLVRLGRPYARILQRRFARASLDAVRRAARAATA